MTEEEHTCLIEEAGGERFDGARVREASHLGYLPEQAKAVTKGTSNDGLGIEMDSDKDETHRKRRCWNQLGCNQMCIFFVFLGFSIA